MVPLSFCGASWRADELLCCDAWGASGREEAEAVALKLCCAHTVESKKLQRINNTDPTDRNFTHRTPRNNGRQPHPSLELPTTLASTRKSVPKLSRGCTLEAHLRVAEMPAGPASRAEGRSRRTRSPDFDCGKTVCGRKPAKANRIDAVHSRHPTLPVSSSRDSILRPCLVPR